MLCVERVITLAQSHGVRGSRNTGIDFIFVHNCTVIYRRLSIFL